MISVGLVVGSPTVASFPLPSITTDTHADKFRTEKRGERERRGYCDKGYDSLPLFRSGTNKTIGGVKEEREREEPFGDKVVSVSSAFLCVGKV